MTKKTDTKPQEFTEQETEMAGNLLTLQKQIHNNAKYLSSAYKGKVAWKDRDRILKDILQSFDAQTDTILKMMLIKNKADEEA